MPLLGLILLNIVYSAIQASPVSHIVNGERAEKCEFPHIAFLYIKKERGTFSCGGSLIDETHIVTAGHCVNGEISGIRALFGSLNVRYMTDVVPVSKWVQHNDYHKTTTTVFNDVAVLTLSRPMQFSSCRKPIRLVKPNEKVSSDCVIAGWGKYYRFAEPSSWLRRADVPIMPPAQCAQKVPGITTQHVCAGDGQWNGKSACKGDSGGPLMCKSAEDGEKVLFGLVSYGWTCEEGFGVYASVAYFNQWITSQTTKAEIEYQ